MAYGLELYDTAGNVIYDSTTVAWSLLDVRIVDPDTPGYILFITYDYAFESAASIGFTEFTYTVAMLEAQPTDQSATCAQVWEIGDNTWSVLPGTHNSLVTILGR
jgi:hypothetical protein